MTSRPISLSATAIALLIPCISSPSPAVAKIMHATVLEKVEQSQLIVVGEYIGSEGTFEIKSGKRHSQGVFPRYIDYRVKDVLKGNHAGKVLRLDFKRTNEKYPPFTCRPAVSSKKDETVVLFLEGDMIIFQGFQGKVDLKVGEADAYVAALKTMVKIGSAKGDARIKMLLEGARSGKDVLESMVKESVVGGWELKDAELTPILANVLENVNESRLTRMRAATRLGYIRGDGAFDALSKGLQDKDEAIRQECAVAIANLGERRAIKVLEEFVRVEKWAEVRKTGMKALKRLKEATELAKPK